MCGDSRLELCQPTSNNRRGEFLARKMQMQDTKQVGSAHACPISTVAAHTDASEWPLLQRVGVHVYIHKDIYDIRIYIIWGVYRHSR